MAVANTEPLKHSRTAHSVNPLSAHSGVREELLRQILDRCVRAILAITRDRQLLYQNAAAQLLTRRNDVLEVREGRLGFADQRVLSRVVNHLDGKSARHRSTPAGLALQLHSRPPNGGVSTPYRVLVTPLGSRPEELQHSATWLVFVSELSTERRIHREILIALYGLTEAESQLAIALFAGCSLEEAAQTQRISINTAKTHLRQIFQKCGVQSQANLLQLLALGPRAF